MKKYLLLFSLIIIMLPACGVNPANLPTATPVDVSVLQTNAVQTVIVGMNETATANAPTNTPLPTNTPSPTRTPIPTSTITPLPDPIIINGQGDNVVDFVKWNEPAILHIKNTGYSNFNIWNYDAQGNKIDLLVNTIGNYEGYLPLDFVDNQKTSRFEVKSDGPWVLEIYPFDIQYMHVLELPGTYTGNSDDVLVIRKNPDIATFNCQAQGNFAVWAYGASEYNLVVNEISPYSGKVVLNSDVFIIVVKAPGVWSVEISNR